MATERQTVPRSSTLPLPLPSTLTHRRRNAVWGARGAPLAAYRLYNEHQRLLAKYIRWLHRCGLTNEDLNRRWISPDEKLHPEIYHTKGLLDFLSRAVRRPPSVFIDFHGHSRKKNIFMYGCSGAESWNSGDRAAAAAAAAVNAAAANAAAANAAAGAAAPPSQEAGAAANPNDHKVLPELMGKFGPAFSLSSCSFRVERCRESTARVTVWREFGIQCSYTLEASYCGCDQGPYQGYHLGASHLKEVGINLCQALSVLREELLFRRSLAAVDASKEPATAETSAVTTATSASSFTTCSTRNANVPLRRKSLSQNK